MDNLLKQHIEALIFAAPQAIALTDIQLAVQENFQTEISEADLLACIDLTRKQYEGEIYAFELVDIADGYQFMTKGAYHIIAYKRPVSKSELEEIRGVSCDYAVQKLLEKELVVIGGRSDGPGRPLLYNTSDKFMDYLGIRSMNDLPKPKDFKEIENTIGDAPSLEEYLPNKNEDVIKLKDLKEVETLADIKVTETLEVVTEAKEEEVLAELETLEVFEAIKEEEKVAEDTNSPEDSSIHENLETK
jgi:segregation and condensation protein B